MPTIPQLPAATQVNADDELPLSQGGVTVSVTVSELLASTQPALTLSSGTLLGRVSLGAGGPEPVAVGTGLAITQGVLSASGGEISTFTQNVALAAGDQVVLNSGGQPALLPATALRALYSAGDNIAISGSGEISANMPLATATTPGSVIPGSGISLGPNGAITINYGTSAGTAAQGNDQRIVDAEQTANKGQPNGYAALDGSGRLPVSQLSAGIAGGLTYQGVWNGAANQPALTSGAGTAGAFYEVGIAGTTTLDGISSWNPGDLVVFSGSAWQKVSGALATVDVSNATALAIGSTNERSLAARFGDVVNIDDFGLARDGVTDDSTRVLAAVNVAIAKAGKLYVPAGGPILLGGAAQIPLYNIAIFGDGLQDIGYPYGKIGSQFLITATGGSPFLLSTSITLDGLVFFYPNQIDQPSAPIVYPPLFTSAADAVQVAMLTIKNCQITNAYDVLTVPENVVCGDVIISGNRICAVNTCFTLPNVPEVIFISDNLFSWGVYEVEYLHGPGGGTHAQTLIALSTVADAPAGSTTLSFSSVANLAVGMPVQGTNIASGATVTAISGTSVTISAATLADVPAGSNITFILNTYYLLDYTATEGTWLLITGNGTATSVSTISHGGIIATNNYVFGCRYGIHVDGGNLEIGRLTNTGFDEVGTVLQCDNYGTVYDLQIDNFITYGLLASNSTVPTTMFVVSNPPPDANGNATARLSVSSMTVGFSSGTLFDVAGTNVAEVKITDCKLTRYANTSSGQPYYALSLNAPNARLLFSGNDVLAASGGNTGIQINAVQTASIVGNAFTGLQAPIDIETTSGSIALSGNVTTSTSGSAAIVGIGTSNIQDHGNAWDQRPLNWNPILPSYMSTAQNGMAFRGDNGYGCAIAALGASANVTLNLVTSGSGSVSMLTRGYSPQVTVLDSANTTTIYASGGSASEPATISAQGSSASGLALQSVGGGAIQLGSVGASGSSVVHKGAVADQSYSMPAGLSGGTYQVPNNTADVQLSTSSGAIGSLTVTLPSLPVDGQILDLASVAPITTLSVQSSNGSAVIGIPSTLSANGCIRLKYLGGSTNTWFHRAYM